MSISDKSFIDLRTHPVGRGLDSGQGKEIYVDRKGRFNIHYLCQSGAGTRIYYEYGSNSHSRFKFRTLRVHDMRLFSIVFSSLFLYHLLLKTRCIEIRLTVLKRRVTNKQGVLGYILLIDSPQIGATLTRQSDYFWGTKLSYYIVRQTICRLHSTLYRSAFIKSAKRLSKCSVPKPLPPTAKIITAQLWALTPRDRVVIFGVKVL